MLPQHHRLRRPQAFAQVKRRGRRWRGGLLYLSALHTDEAVSRFGFVVSGRVGNAVTRNRVKRRLREIIRPLLSTVTSGWDIVIVAYPSAADADYHQLEKEVRRLLERASLL